MERQAGCGGGKRSLGVLYVYLVAAKKPNKCIAPRGPKGSPILELTRLDQA